MTSRTSTFVFSTKLSRQQRQLRDDQRPDAGPNRLHLPGIGPALLCTRTTATTIVHRLYACFGLRFGFGLSPGASGGLVMHEFESGAHPP